jgi:hypothetical protein
MFDAMKWKLLSKQNNQVSHDGLPRFINEDACFGSQLNES